MFRGREARPFDACLGIFMTPDPVARSFEIAAERCEDLTPLVYERLFREMPELQAMFRTDSRLVRGEMLARTIEALLDFAGDRTFGGFFVSSEATTHAGYDVPPRIFVQFFRVVRDTMRDILGADWSDDMDSAWRELLADLSACIDQSAAA
jgi:hemoglobin-like flavoprotein